MSIALSIHTTTAVLELAIAVIDPVSSPSFELLKASSWDLGRDLSTRIHACLVEVLDGYGWTELAYIAVARGVGSYTGTRIGVVLARTLGQQLDIPVYAIGCEAIDRHANAGHPPLRSGVSLLELAHHQWQNQIYPQWNEALPDYGDVKI